MHFKNHFLLFVFLIKFCHTFSFSYTHNKYTLEVLYVFNFPGLIFGSPGLTIKYKQDINQLICQQMASWILFIFFISFILLIYFVSFQKI